MAGVSSRIAASPRHPISPSVFVFPQFPISVSRCLRFSLFFHLFIPVSPRHPVSASLLLSSPQPRVSLSPHFPIFFSQSPCLRVSVSPFFPIFSSLRPRFTASPHLRVPSSIISLSPFHRVTPLWAWGNSLSIHSVPCYS